MAPCDISAWITGDWSRCLFDPAVIGAPTTVFGLIVGGGVMFSFYVAGRSIATPTVLLILLSSILIPVLPGAYVGIANGLAVVGVMAAVFALLQKYVMSPSV
jgi:hypothetical protein